MSYSFNVTAKTKDEIGIKVEAELEKVVSSQPTHEVDRQVAQDAAEALVDILTNTEENEIISVNVSGSVSWQGEGDYKSANLSINTSIQKEQ